MALRLLLGENRALGRESVTQVEAVTPTGLRSWTEVITVAFGKGEHNSGSSPRLRYGHHARAAIEEDVVFIGDDSYENTA